MMKEPVAGQSRPRRSRAALWLIVLLALAGGGGYAWYTHSLRTKAEAEKRAAANAAPVRVPVDVVTAERGDFPVVLNGLGTVRAWNSVIVRSRVDGQIQRIAFNEGQTVREGDLLATIDSRPYQAALDQARAKKSLDEALLANQKRDLDRYQRVGNLAVTQQQIDTQRALVAQQEAQIRSDQGAIDNAETQLSYTTIRAPIAGRMGFRLVDAGNIVQANDTNGVATITEVQPIGVVFTAPEEELPRINKALAGGPLPVTAASSDGQTMLGRGSVTLIDNQVDAATGSVRLKGRFENADNALWPGLTVSTRLLIDTRRDTVVIPDIAVQRGPNGLFTYVIRPDETAEMRALVVSDIADGQAAVTDGLEAGDRVVTSGFYRLQPDAPVKINKSKSERKTAGPAGDAAGVQAQ